MPHLSPHEAAEPLVSVLTPVLNEEHHLDSVIRDMLRQDVAGGVEFLFIDGGSTDRSVEILARWSRADPRVRILRNPARRTPQALNIGLREARGQFVARMDAHTHYPDGYLRIGVERLARGDVVSVSGPQIARGSGRWSRRVALALQTPLGFGGARFRTTGAQEFEVDSAFTGLWRKSTLEEHGGWHEEWLNDQDLELAARLRRGGGRLVCVPEMAASYIPRDSLRRLAAQYGRYGRYRVKTSRRHPDSLRPSQLLPPALAMATVAGCTRIRFLKVIARPALASYAVVVSVASIRAAYEAPRRDAASLPVVFAVMHLSYGFGFIAGVVEFGPPLRAVARLAQRMTGRLTAR